MKLQEELFHTNINIKFNLKSIFLFDWCVSNLKTYCLYLILNEF